MASIEVGQNVELRPQLGFMKALLREAKDVATDCTNNTDIIRYVHEEYVASCLCYPEICGNMYFRRRRENIIQP